MNYRVCIFSFWDTVHIFIFNQKHTFFTLFLAAEENEVAPTSCDFETPSLCGWVNDPEHDFDWKRKCLGTPSGILGTGPSYDHTHGSGQLGKHI